MPSRQRRKSDKKIKDTNRNMTEDATDPSVAEVPEEPLQGSAVRQSVFTLSDVTSDMDDDTVVLSEPPEQEEQEEEDEEPEPPEQIRRASSMSRSDKHKSAPKLPQILVRAPELKAVYDEVVYEVDLDPPFLTPYPDVEEMYHKAQQKVTANSTPDVYRSELRKVYEVLSQVRSNEAELKRKLTKREHEVEDLAFRLKQDPRVAKVLVLADRWRREKAEAEEVSNEYLAELNSIRADIRTMENNLNILRKNNKKMTEELEARKKLEKKMDELEEINLQKEQRIAELHQALHSVQEDYNDIKHDAQREKEELIAKLESVPNLSHSSLEDMRKQLERTKAENFKLKVEISSKATTIQALQKNLNMTKYHMGQLNKNISHLKRKSKKLHDSLQKVSRNLAKCEAEKETLTLVAQSLNTENTRRGVHYKTMSRSLKQCDTAKARLIFQAEARNKEIFKCSNKSRDLQMEIERLLHELSVSRELEGNMQKVLDSANRQIQTLKNKLYLSEAKANYGVAELKYQKNLLSTAKANAEGLGKNLKHIISEMKSVYYRMASCNSMNIEKNNAIRHLETVCRHYQDVIRIQDSENDSLIISSQKLEQLLKKTRDSMLVLRQKNAEAATEAHMQAELFTMLTYMLKFTETEKDTAVKITCNSDNTIIFLRQESARRLHEILKLSEEVHAQKQLVKNFVKTLEHEKHENNHLIRLLHEADLEQQDLKRHYYQLRYERDVFGAMVIQCRTENELLVKKMSVMDSMLKAGFFEVRKQSMDMRILKIEIRNLRRKLNSFQGIDFINGELRSELVDTCRALQLEQDKRAAIENLKQPVPHHHRFLMHARLTEYEMVMKIQKLQSILVSKYKEISSKDSALHTRNKQLLQLKLLLAKRPGVDCYEELTAAKELLHRKNKQIKSLLGELNAARYDIETKEKKNEDLLAEMRNDKHLLAEYKRKATAISTAVTKSNSELTKRKPFAGGLRLNVTKPKQITATLTPLCLTK